ncbi:Peptidase S1C, HtrA family [Nitrospira japonica]|uniref:Peptidase S1C, HtrA family n=1 Tax=Nitrospira japonica TaxID=1325564 RepID=A0A1W1I577_9BACT|nr:trypsin-like peptidase domain-containing protein [Nitrospira japonica]SLM48152.1 Peptidase S1C, HtrA family [Nitrospira japonica]
MTRPAVHPSGPIICLAALLSCAPSVQAADWGKPLGATYDGPEGKARAVTPAPLELAADERATMAVFERVTKSVVFIANTAIQRDPWSFDLLEAPQGSGSGFVWNKQGHIVTNFHVVYGASSIKVTLADRSEYKAVLIGADPDHDLAVLQIQATDDALSPITVGSSNDLRVGQKVLAIGNPFGLDHSLTTGVVSALGRTIKSLSNRTIEGVIQTDAAINPGNSGGPLLDGTGRLIGVNTQIVSPSGAFAGIGFAVPVDTVNRIVPELIKHGKLIRPGLGVSLVPDAMAKRWGVKGLIIGKVSRGGAAERAGLQGARETMPGRVELGDVIVSVNNRPVSTVDELMDVMEDHKVGDRVTVDILRNNRRQSVTVTLQAIN